MFQSVLAALAVTVLTSAVFAAEYPTMPDSKLTPGSYCTNPNSRRYKEQIPYCNRNVDSSEKMRIIDQYNKVLGYNITRGDRPNFKIDHLIPLCAGGSNEFSNLWPQHRSVYEITDPVEGIACELMAKGKLTQKRAIEMIFQAKYHLDQAPDVIRQLKGMN